MKTQKYRPTISVVIPVYNKERYVGESIQSVLNQSHQDFELIIVNDASIDKSLEIVKTFSDPRIRVFERSVPGPGGYAARNLGVEKAVTEWIAFLDADDQWASNHLEEAKLFIDKWQVEFFSFGYQVYKDEKSQKVSYPNEGVYSSSLGIEEFGKCDIFNTNSVIIKKRLFVKEGGFPAGKARMGGDADLWLRLLLSTDKVGFSPKVTSFQIKDRGGIITNPNNKTEKHPLVKTVEKYLKKNILSIKEKKLLKLISNRKSLSWSLHRKRYGTFKYREILHLYPSVFYFKDYIRVIVLLIPKIIYIKYHKMLYGNN